MEGTSYVGSVALYSDRLVIEENLNNLLQQQIKKAEQVGAGDAEEAV